MLQWYPFLFMLWKQDGVVLAIFKGIKRHFLSRTAKGLPVNFILEENKKILFKFPMSLHLAQVESFIDHT